jgi:hypothetical protein
MKLKKVQILTLPTDFKAVGVVSPIQFTGNASHMEQIYMTDSCSFQTKAEAIK